MSIVRRAAVAFVKPVLGPDAWARLTALAGHSHEESAHVFAGALCGWLDGSAPGRVAVVGSATVGLARSLGEQLPGSRVEQVQLPDPVEGDGLGRAAAAMHVELAARGPFGMVVLDAPDGGLARRLVAAVAYHVEAGGWVLVRDGADPDAPTGRMVERFERLRLRKRPGRKARPEARDRWYLAQHLTSPEQVGRHLALRCGEAALAKVDETQMNDLLAVRPGTRDIVLQRIPGVKFASRCVLRHSDPGDYARARPSFAAPEMSLRSYRDVVCLPGQVVTQGNLLLPDTFRHNGRPRLKNRYVEDVAPRFGRVDVDLERVPLLPGTYFHLDSEFRGHFGHLMTEQVSRLWGWEPALREVPDLKVLVALNKQREMREWEFVFLEAAGIRREDVVFVREPVRVERLLSASSMMSQPRYIHPRIAEQWAVIGDALDAAAPECTYPERIFCSRRLDKRSCRNAAEVEQAFAARGYEIVFTEDYPLPEQVRMFRRARVIAGFAGSALFTTSLVGEPKPVVTVASESYVARNEYMIASVLGHSLDVVVCRAEIAHPENGWSVAAFHSPFTFDPARECVFLQDRLASLP